MFRALPFPRQLPASDRRGSGWRFLAQKNSPNYLISNNCGLSAPPTNPSPSGGTFATAVPNGR